MILNRRDFTRASLGLGAAALFEPRAALAQLFDWVTQRVDRLGGDFRKDLGQLGEEAREEVAFLSAPKPTSLGTRL